MSLHPPGFGVISYYSRWMSICTTQRSTFQLMALFRVLVAGEGFYRVGVQFLFQPLWITYYDRQRKLWGYSLAYRSPYITRAMLKEVFCSRTLCGPACDSIHQPCDRECSTATTRPPAFPKNKFRTDKNLEFFYLGIFCF